MMRIPLFCTSTDVVLTISPLLNSKYLDSIIREHHGQHFRYINRDGEEMEIQINNLRDVVEMISESFKIKA